MNCVCSGEPVGDKTSSAYGPPELARGRVAGRRTVAEAAASFDVWAFGVLFYEMCAGRNLFAQDTANDELIDSADIW